MDEDVFVDVGSEPPTTTYLGEAAAGHRLDHLLHSECLVGRVFSACVTAARREELITSEPVLETHTGERGEGETQRGTSSVWGELHGLGSSDRSTA